MKSVTITLLTFLSTFTFAQSNYIGFGGRLGLYNVTNSTANTQFSFNYGAGVNYLHQFENNLRLTSGIYYAKQGAKHNILGTNSTGQIVSSYEIKHHFNYLSIPLLAGYTFNLTNINFYGNVGVSAFYLLYENYNINENTIKNISYINTFDFSALINLGFEIPIKEKLLFLTDFTFNKGFISVSDSIYSPFKSGQNIGVYSEIGLKYKL